MKGLLDDIPWRSNIIEPRDDSFNGIPHQVDIYWSRQVEFCKVCEADVLDVDCNWKEWCCLYYKVYKACSILGNVSIQSNHSKTLQWFKSLSVKTVVKVTWRRRKLAHHLRQFFLLERNRKRKSCIWPLEFNLSSLPYLVGRQTNRFNPLYRISMKFEVVSQSQPPQQLHESLRAYLRHAIKHDYLVVCTSRIIQWPGIQRAHLSKWAEFRQITENKSKRILPHAIKTLQSSNAFNLLFISHRGVKRWSIFLLV